MILLGLLGLNDYQWLHYDAELDAAFCYICMKAFQGGRFLTIVPSGIKPSLVKVSLTGRK